MNETLLLIEDEPLLRGELERHFQGAGWNVFGAATLAHARAALEHDDLQPLVVVSDMSLPDGNALDLLETARKRDGAAEWVFLTGYGGVADSVRALRLGAYDFLEKPCELERLDLVVAGAMRSARAQRQLHEQADAGIRRYTPDAFLGHSDAARQVRSVLGKLAAAPFSALFIAGETGTGKGLAARILHHSGKRRSGPMIEVNCAALPHQLLESELFGHEPGAFTDAKGKRRGLLEQAHGGTIFLDEIGELPLDLQAKLLSAIEDRKVRRLGGTQSIEVDIQVLAASNRNLAQQVEAKGFRSDLYHRICVFTLELPALRERIADLRDLVPQFIAEFNAKSGKAVRVVEDAVWQALERHHWPGNVRELRNVIERCVLLSDGAVLSAQWLQLTPTPAFAVPAQVREDEVLIRLDGSMTLDHAEKAVIAAALERCAFNVTAAARLLGTSRETLRYRVNKYGLKALD